MIPKIGKLFDNFRLWQGSHQHYKYSELHNTLVNQSALNKIKLCPIMKIK